MARSKKIETELVTYEAKVHITVTRRTDTYHSDTLADVRLEEQFPLTLDVRLNNLTEEIDNRVTEAQAKIVSVLMARGEFQRKVQLALGSGDIIEADPQTSF